MKIQCNVCESAEATVLCCADEAALCCACDEKVHAANKLAGKHQRVSLSHHFSHIPRCDICQDAVGYIFCLEDRALLCRKCDVAIHTANSLVTTHQRFLLTGVKVGLEPVEHGSSSSGVRTQSGEKVSDAENHTLPTKRSAHPSTSSEYNGGDSVQSGAGAIKHSNKRSMPSSVSDYAKMQPVQSGILEDLMQSRMSFTGGSAAGNMSQWSIDDFFGMNDYQQNYGFTDNASSKADSGKLGESDSSSLLRSWEDDLDSNDRLGEVPDVSWAVPPVPSPPTASGLYWPKSSAQLADNSLFVPDLGWSHAPDYHHNTLNPNAGKRRRQP